MKKDWFKVKMENNTRFVVKVKDEETKNHKNTDDAITSAFMPEMPGDKFCLVSSYVHYFNALSPKSDSLWTTLIFTPFPVNRKTTWYNGTLGHNKLDNFVANICKDLGKDDNTNQCLRSMTITVLGRLDYGNKQIMSVSGHKSSTSLDMYQKVNDAEKMSMGTDLGKVLMKRKITKSGPNKNTACLTAPSKTVNNNALVTVTLNKDQQVQFVQRGEIWYEIPEDPEYPIPPKHQMLQNPPTAVATHLHIKTKKYKMISQTSILDPWI